MSIRFCIFKEFERCVRKHFFSGFDPARQAQYEKEAAQRWGEEQVNESRGRWSAYSPQEQQAVMAEGNAIYQEMIRHIDQDAHSAEVQQMMARWHEHIRRFYEPTREIMLGLAELYISDPAFVANFERMHPALPHALNRAIVAYCAGLEQTE